MFLSACLFRTFFFKDHSVIFYIYLLRQIQLLIFQHFQLIITIIFNSVIDYFNKENILNFKDSKYFSLLFVNFKKIIVSKVLPGH